MKTNILRKLFILGAVLIAFAVSAATVSRIKTFSDGEILTASDLNAEFDNIVDGVNSITNDNIASNAAISPAKISSAIKGSGITRNPTSGSLSVNPDNAGIEIVGDAVSLKNLGVTTAKINDLAVTTGKIAANAVTRAKLAVIDQTPAGAIMQFHTFNGAVSIPRGWMPMNGNIINEANYNATHGAGAYSADGVASSALLGKYLPNMANRYLVGSATTTQTGAAPITSVGNANNQVNLQHSHNLSSGYVLGTVEAGKFWARFKSIGAGVWTGTNNFFDTNTVSSSTSTPTTGFVTGGSSGNSLSSTQSIQPESIQVIFIMKVI